MHFYEMHCFIMNEWLTYLSNFSYTKIDGKCVLILTPFLLEHNIIYRLLNSDGELLSENKMMPYPKDTIGLQNPNLVVSSVSHCTQCENNGSYTF